MKKRVDKYMRGFLVGWKEIVYIFSKRERKEWKKLMKKYKYVFRIQNYRRNIKECEYNLQSEKLDMEKSRDTF